jgi:8-oxo-dGTP pyrophosphatase MutT (NUDIX family)
MPLHLERSAGVLVYRPDPRPDPGGERDNSPHFLLLDYGRFWDYPKGHVEPGEDDLAAATRELREETGIDDIALHEGFRHELSYFFRDKRKGLVKKTVVFFLGRTAAEEAKISHEHVGAAFLPYEAALARVTYPNAKQALAEAKAFLDGLSAG